MKAVTKAYNAVRAGIIEGRYAPAARITEQEVAEITGVSRTPVREALRRLHAEGLLRFVPHQGAFVNHWSEADVEDIFELRAMLESFGARRAARNASDEQVAELRRLAESQYRESQECRPGYLERIADLNSRFHQLVQESAGSHRLRVMMGALIETPLVLQTFREYSDEDLVRSAAHHLEIVRALEARDEDWAASVMRSHVLAARRVYRLRRRTERPDGRR
jgi:DNA-binding GntR family transcriptional regulator